MDHDTENDITEIADPEEETIGSSALTSPKCHASASAPPPIADDDTEIGLAVGSTQGSGSPGIAILPSPIGLSEQATRFAIVLGQLAADQASSIVPEEQTPKVKRKQRVKRVTNDSSAPNLSTEQPLPIAPAKRKSKVSVTDTEPISKKLKAVPLEPEKRVSARCVIT
jgi:hypothetical protein